NNEEKGAAAVVDLNSKYGDGKAVFIKCDVTKDLDDVSKKIFETYSQVDVLVNNAGTVDEKSARKTIELNSIALMEWSMKFWEHMRKDKGGLGGTILNIGSIYSFAIDPYVVFYKASKFAVQGFTTSLGHADNYKKFGVRLIIICPGFTYSALTDRQLCWDEHKEDFAKFVKNEKWQNAE
ncbi:Alcohol dehydrogenase, partial [Operophtera brumata]